MNLMYELTVQATFLIALAFSAIFICMTGSFGMISGNPPIITLKEMKLQKIKIYIETMTTFETKIRNYF